MTHLNIKASFITATLLAFTALSSQALALECPKPQAESSSGVLKQSEEDIAKLENQLRDGTAGNAVNEIIYAVKKKFPNVTAEEVINYLVTAYCPIVAQDKGQTETQAREKLDAFAMQVRKIYEN